MSGGGGGGSGGGAEILRVGMVSPVGLTAEVTAAAVGAGIDRFAESSILDRRFNPLVMSLVATPDLPPLLPAVDALPGLTSRQMRMLRLAGVALRECLGEAPPAKPGLPLLLAGPEPLPEGRPAPAGPAFLEQLAAQAERPLELARSKVIPAGRAGVMAALEEALAGLAARRYDQVLVGGVDTYLDLYLLGTLDLEERLKATGTFDGFIPGEGAAFLWLARPGTGARRGVPVLGKIEGAATAEEAGHRYSKQAPYRGDGLDAALKKLFAQAPGGAIPTVYAGFNGENFMAKEWGVAALRHKKRLPDDIVMEHPADCVGDAGAALGAMLVAVAALAVKGGDRKGPALVWCSSDLATRGAALVSGG